MNLRFWKRPKKDPSAVPVVDMKFLIILHVLMLSFIAFIHWKVSTMHDF